MRKNPTTESYPDTSLLVICSNSSLVIPFQVIPNSHLKHLAISLRQRATTSSWTIHRYICSSKEPKVISKTTLVCSEHFLWFPNKKLCDLFSSSSLSFKCALRESACRIGYEPTKDELRSLSAVDIQGHQRGVFCIVSCGILKREIQSEILCWSLHWHWASIFSTPKDKILLSSCVFLSVSELPSTNSNFISIKLYHVLLAYKIFWKRDYIRHHLKS